MELVLSEAAISKTFKVLVVLVGPMRSDLRNYEKATLIPRLQACTYVDFRRTELGMDEYGCISMGPKVDPEPYARVEATAAYSRSNMNSGSRSPGWVVPCWSRSHPHPPVLQQWAYADATEVELKIHSAPGVTAAPAQ